MPVADPPGDPAGVRSAAGHLDALAAHARTLSATMLAGTGVARAGIWAGRDAAAFTATVTATAGALAADADHLAAAGGALRAYARSLESDQRKVADLAGRIDDLEDDTSGDPAAPVDHDDEIRGLRRRMDEWRNDAQVVGNITARELDGLTPAQAPGIGPIASTLTGITEAIEGIDGTLQGYADMVLPSWLPTPSSASRAGLDLRAWLIQTWADPSAGYQAAKAWAAGGLRSAVNADDFERGDWVAGLLKTLLPDSAYNIGKAEAEWALRTWHDPAAGFGELGGFLGGLVHADLWRQGRYLEASARLVASDASVDDWRTGHRARAVGRLVPDLVMTLLTGGEGKAVTASKAVTGEVIDVSVKAVVKPALKEVVIIDGDDLVIRAESRAEGWIAASDPPAIAVEPVPVPEVAPAPLALDDPALRADQIARLRRWFVEQAEAFEFTVSDGGRRISLHTPGDRTGQAIEAVWQAFARDEWLAEPGRKVVSIHGSYDFGAFSVGFDPTPFGFRVAPRALAQWLRPALVEGELSEVFLLACKAGGLDSGLQSRLVAHVDQAVAALAGTVPEDLAPSLRRAVADVLAGQATEAAGKPSLSWVLNKHLWDERTGMWRDRQLADLYELITSPWQVRGSRAAAIARLTPDQLERLLYETGDAWARQQGRSFKVMNELGELLEGKLEQIPFTHTGAGIGDAIRSTLTEALSAAMGPAASPNLIDRIATEAEGRVERWFSLGVDETTIGLLREAIVPVLAGHVDALGASAAGLFEDLTDRLAGEITRAYDATMAQQFADELGVPVLAGRQNVQFVIDGSGWGVDGFYDPWVYGLRRFEPGKPGSAAPRNIPSGGVSPP